METGRRVSDSVKPVTLPVTAWAASMVGAVIATGCGFEDLGIAPCPSRLLPGQLVITEILPDPGADPGADPGGATGEWFEIFNATDQTVDLRGLVLAVDGGGEALQRHVMRAGRIAPGAYFVLGRDGAEESATPIDYVYGDALDPLPDHGGRVTLRCDVITVDVAVYPEAAPGVAVGLSGASLPDAVSNDEPASWCAARGGFAPGRAGSPGAVNEACAGAPGPSPGNGTCEQDGAVREVVAPAPGDLVITEVMANPAAVSDNAGEWVEVYVGRDVDLDRLSVGTEPGALRVVIADGACQRAAAGSHVLLAAGADAATNGGLGAIAGELGLGLRNSGGNLVIGHGDVVLDQVAWASAPSGRSLALDPAHRSPAANDVAAHWCPSPAGPYGSGDIGTPGAANGACDDAPGDPPGDAGVPGDAGMPGDAAPAVPLCSDGAGTMRPIISPASGSVRITELMADSRAVADSDGEWIEVRFDQAADLNGVELGKVPGQVLVTIEAPQCLPVAAGTHVILARTTDPDRNGGLPRVDAMFGFGLVNTGGSLFVGVSGAVLDQVSYGEAEEAGASASLDEGDGMTWCTSPMDAVYGRGDRGTPGAPNPACPEAEPNPEPRPAAKPSGMLVR